METSFLSVRAYIFQANAFLALFYFLYSRGFDQKRFTFFSVSSVILKEKLNNIHEII